MKYLLSGLVLLFSSYSLATVEGSYACAGLGEDAYPIELDLEVNSQGVIVETSYDDDGEMVLERDEFNYGPASTQGWVFKFETEEDGYVDNSAYKVVNLNDKAIRIYLESTYELDGEYPESDISIVEFFKSEYEEHYVLKVDYDSLMLMNNSDEYQDRDFEFEREAGVSILRCVRQ